MVVEFNCNAGETCYVGRFIHGNPGLPQSMISESANFYMPRYTEELYMFLLPGNFLLYLGMLSRYASIHYVDGFCASIILIDRVFSYH